jgi:hypothetical protein
VGDLEKFFVQRIAFHMIRLQRAERLEAEYITAEIHPPVLGPTLPDPKNLLSGPPEVIDPGIPAAIGPLGAVNLVAGFQRYETSIENKLYRAINELERMQRMRGGEYVPARQVLDVSLHSRSENMGSLGKATET